MSRDELVAWIRETEERVAQVPAALALLHDHHAMSYGEISVALGGHKGTVFRRARRSRRAADATD